MHNLLPAFLTSENLPDPAGTIGAGRSRDFAGTTDDTGSLDSLRQGVRGGPGELAVALGHAVGPGAAR